MKMSEMIEELTSIGKIDKIEIKTSLNHDERKIRVNYIDFSSELKQRFRAYKRDLSRIYA